MSCVSNSFFMILEEYNNHQLTNYQLYGRIRHYEVNYGFI